MNRLAYLLLLCISIFFVACHSQEHGLTKHDRIEIFEQVWSIVNEDFYDPKFNGINWGKIHVEYKTKIEDCNNTDSLFILLNEMLFELNSSHCGVGLIAELDKVISPYLFGNGETGIDVRIIENQVVVTSVLQNSSADIANIKPGYIINKIDDVTISEIEKRVSYKPPFNRRNKTFHLTSDILRHIYGQAGTEVKIEFLDESHEPHTEILIRKGRINGTSLGTGFPPAYLKSEGHYLQDSIAYISFNAFNPSDLSHVMDDMEKVNRSKGLIIDLRGNDGGSIEGMKLLLGNFVAERIRYGTYINRSERNEDYIVPTGKKYQSKVVLLIDEMSISAAENMAGIIQYLEIGTIIGNKTPGQMLWGNGYLINDSIALAVPIYKLEYPNGFNPENNGITPDIAITMKREDLLLGEDTQLSRAINYLSNEYK